MSRKLVYFDVPGYAECIRYMLHYGGLKFEDVRYTIKEWPIQEVKDSLPFGQLPLYEEDGRTLNQSIAIARYVAGQVGLLPEDAWEQAKLDAAVLNIYDLQKKLGATHSETDEEKKKALREEAIAYFFSRFEKALIESNGHFGAKLSWADFILAALILSFNEFLQTNVEKDYPAIKSLLSEVTTLPGVKEYIANKKPSV